MNPNGPTDRYEIEYNCGLCRQKGELTVTCRQGQPFVQVPDIWCVECSFRMHPNPPKKIEAPLIAQPSLVAPLDLKRKY